MNTFLGRSLNILIIFSSYLFFRLSSLKNIAKLLKLYKKASFFFGSFYCLVIFFYFFSGRPSFLKNQLVIARQTYHTELYFIVPIALLELPYILRFFFLSAGIFSWKNTGFIISFLNLVLLIKYNLIRRLKSFSQKVFVVFFLFLLMVCLLSVSFYIQKYYGLKLPNGSPKVRLKTYYVRFESFLDSPIVGDFFTGNPNVKIENLVLPSHSDVLDILAFGGLFGFFLFFYPILSGLKLKLSKFDERIFVEFDVFSRGIILSSLVAMFFNPLLQQPSWVFFFYFWLGYRLAFLNRI